LIEVSHLTFEYTGLRALGDVSFTIDTGSITALVGPNGAGKSTLMRCICGLERPLAGSIKVNGIDVIEEPRRSHEHIGYLPDFFGLYNSLRIAQCFQYTAEANGVAKVDPDLITKTANRLNLSNRLQQPVGQLSRGLRQRVAIGQAIIHDPSVLILDEPAAGLDPEARFALADLFKSLQAAGMTLFVSSHILAELETYATEMLVIRQGQIIDHRQLAQTVTEQRRLRVALSQPDIRLRTWLENHASISAVKIEGNSAIFDFRGNEDAQHQLLKQLVTDDFTPTRLTIEKTDLQQSYLATMKDTPTP